MPPSSDAAQPSTTPNAESDQLPQALFGVDTGRLADAAEWVWEHREQLMDLVERVPQLLDQAGGSIASAGEGAVATADLLTGSDDQPGVSGLAESAGKVLAGCRQELSELNDQLTGLADQLDRIDLPGVGKVFDAAAERVRGGAERVNRVADGLEDVASKMGSIGTGVGEAAHGLRQTGTNLSASGATLQGLLGTPASATTAKSKAAGEPTKVTSKPKPTTKGSSEAPSTGVRSIGALKS
ncbi:MAG: hypothetical protein R2754_17420 [Microthrixaceae bacterium]